ncbi:hypothetical protein D9M70_654050 [compost metagenome]
MRTERRHGRAAPCLVHHLGGSAPEREFLGLFHLARSTLETFPMAVHLADHDHECVERLKLRLAVAAPYPPLFVVIYLAHVLAS